MRTTTLASCLAALTLVACQPDAGDEGADEAEASSAGSTSASTAESESSSASEASSTDATSTDASSTDATSTDATSTDASSTDASSTDASSTDATSTDSTSTDSTASSTTQGESTSDTGFESCEMIEMLYDELVNSPLHAACTDDADCHVVDGHCWMGLGGCWYVVNQNLQQTDLEQLANGFSGLGCFGPICLCLEAPDSVGCVEGTCMAL